MKPLTHPDHFREALPFLGRLMLYPHERNLWEDDNRLLPWPLRRRRRMYRDFAVSRLGPLALGADRDPHSVDKAALFRDYALRGFATELLPWPVGSYPLLFMPWWGLHMALKAEEFCAVDGGLGLMLLAHDLGFAPIALSGSVQAVLDFGRPIYRRLKREGTGIMSFAITEPGAGSDVEETEGAARAKLVTRARPAPGGYLLNGRKVFITDGAIAQYVTVFACLGDGGAESWTCFLVERGMKGFSTGRQERKMGQRAGDATELIFEDVFVPERNRIGAERAGWAMNRGVLNASRPAVGAIALGIGRGAFDRCLEFCRATRLAGKALVEYQEVQIELAAMLVKLSAARALCWQSISHGMRPMPAASAGAKVFCSDTAVEVCARAMELMGDHGFLHGQGVEKALRDARLTQIYEGSNQINLLGIVEDFWEGDFKPRA